MDRRIDRKGRGSWPTGRANRRLCLSGLAAVLGFLSLTGLPCQSQLRPHAVSVLRKIGVIRRLTPEELAKSPPVHVRGVVTYYDSPTPNLFIQDNTGGIWVDLRGTTRKPPQPGEVLDVRGVAEEGFSPYIAHPVWKMVGHAPLPMPLHLAYEQAATGMYDAQWVEVDGVVRSFVEEAAGNILVIDVATPTGAFKVRVPNYVARFPMYLVDATVRFQGVCGSAFNRMDQLVAIHLMMPSLADANVLQPAPRHLFQVPVTPIARISLDGWLSCAAGCGGRPGSFS